MGSRFISVSNIKERFKNILNYKKPAAWVVMVSVMLVIALIIGFTSNRLSPGNLSDIGETNTIMTLDDVRALAKKGDALKFEDLSGFRGVDVSSNTSHHIMLYGVEGGYRFIVQTDGKRIDSTALERIWDGGGSDIDIRYNDVDEFIKSHPSSEAKSRWQDITIGMLRDEVHNIMGEPDGMLFGLFGDIYNLGDGSHLIIYYDSESKVNHIKRNEPSTDPSLPTSSEAPDEDMELIAMADLDRNGRAESIYLDKTRIESNHGITLRILDSNGNEIWNESSYLAHAGWTSLFLLEQDGEYYLLRYHPTMYQGYGTYVYTLFTLEAGKEKVYQTNSLEFDINSTKELDVQKMISFADEVNALLDKSILLMSTEGGDFFFGPSAEPFYERYSWLDENPELYEDGDDLAIRLKKYSDYAISRRKVKE